MNEDMKRRIERMASRTWDAIGDDCLVNEDGMPDESVTLPRDHVIEIVCDADYMSMYGHDEEAYKTWKALPSYEEKLAVIRGAFPCKTYGW